jgi:SPP1 gp7 family putative phage head morphogenesis protein
MKYATDNKLDLATVNQLITPIELSEYTEKMEQLRAMYRDTKSEYILREIKELEARMTITRFQALQDSINVELCKVTHEFQMTLEDTLIGLFTEQYKEASEMLGIMNPTIPTEAIKKIIEYPYHGKMFADSVWDNKKNLLINHINKNLTIGIIRGDSVQKMSKQLMKDLDVLYWQAERLIRTETNYTMNQAHLQGYKDSEVVEKYEVLAYIDKRTSKICKRMDRKTFKLSEAQVGVNYPPFHPFAEPQLSQY